MPFLEQRFELTPTGLPVSQAGQPVSTPRAQWCGRLGLWGRMGMFVGRRHELDLLRACGHPPSADMVRSSGWSGEPRSWQVTTAVGLRAASKGRRGCSSFFKRERLLLGTQRRICRSSNFFGNTSGSRGQPAAARDRIARTLSALDPSLGSTLSALAALLDIQGEDEEWAGLDSRQVRQRILDAVRRLVLRQAHEKPVLFLLEDAHWIDSETQAVLNRVFSRVSQRHASSSAPGFSSRIPAHLGGPDVLHAGSRRYVTARESGRIAHVPIGRGSQPSSSEAPAYPVDGRESILPRRNCPDPGGDGGLRGQSWRPVGELGLKHPGTRNGRGGSRRSH